MKNGALIFVALFWSTLTLLFDGFTLVPAARQVLAQRFATTEGMVQSSEVTRHRGSKGGTTHGVKITYSYQVGGRQFTGDRYRYGNFSSSDSAWAEAAVQQHPAGSPTTVYYDPAAPAESVLTTGLAGSDLFIALFLAPFNAIMIGLWWAALSRLTQRWRRPLAGGVRLRTTMQGTRACLTELSPWGAALTAIGVLAFLGIFVVAFALGGFHPSLRTAGSAWIIVITGGLLAGGWHGKNIAQGKYDLVLDELNDRVQLPRTGGRQTVTELARAEIRTATVETIVKRSSKGRDRRWFAPTLQLTNGTTEKLAEWTSEERARGFVAWLNERLTGNSASVPAS